MREASPANILSTFAGNGFPVDKDGTGTAAGFDQPYGVAVDAAGYVYVSDGDNLIRLISPSGNVTTLAGNNNDGGYFCYNYTLTNGVGLAATFNCPDGIAVDALGNLYLADSSNNLIRKISPQ